MRMLSNMKVATRLAAGFGVVLAGSLLMGLGGWLGIHHQASITKEVLARDVGFARDVGAIRVEVLNLRRYEKDILLNAADHARVREYKAKWDATHKAVEALALRAASASADDAERDLLARFGVALGEYSRGLQQIEGAVRAGQISSPAEGNRRIEQFKQPIHETESLTAGLLEGSIARVGDLKARMERIERQTSAALALVALLVLACAAAIAVLISRSITRPVREAVRIAEAIAAGDLSIEVEVRSNDEMGRLMLALRGTVGKLAEIVARIKAASETVNAATRDISQANMDLSTRTEEQASALEETSASMQQMTATVAQNAQSAKQANALASEAASVAVRGGEAMRVAVGTMSGLSESSKRIADIIGVIDGIAFQTNILALNAAVEAARAGDQGRGFAVVAAEVRSLAQRSAAAAKEIKALITDSVTRVDAGSRQVNDAGATMEGVEASVKKVSLLIADITKASEEQSQGIGQVSEALTQLEQVTQQNAAMVEEAAAAAGMLQDQSLELTGAVAVFRLQQAAALPLPEPVRRAQAVKSRAALPRKAAGARIAAVGRAPVGALAGKAAQEDPGSWRAF